MPTAHNGDCEIYYETFGDFADPALLMVNGLGSQCINYQDAWCAKFAARGLLVIRFDNRDMGLSTHFTDASVGAQGECYTLSDMAADCVAVLDDLDIEAAHVMGLSMGGMIVQTLAIEHPERVRTLTSVMSNTGEPGYGASSERALALLLGPPATDRASAVAAALAGLDEWGSPEFADVALRTAAAERAFDRCFDPAGTARQFMAVRASGSRADQLRALRVPTLVMHGDRDNLIGPDGGRRTADLIPGARFELIEGMGHDYPPQLWDRWVDLVAGHIAANP
jgi:pimeloyl-ACP methyl ester carboxylesterase